ncbi:hypothetical protein AAC387_Pa07g2193 [Persea americana]
MAHWFVLYNTPEVIPYLEEHKRQVNELGGRNITNLQREELSGWFRDHINQLRSQGSTEATDAFKKARRKMECVVECVKRSNAKPSLSIFLLFLTD